MSLPRTTPDRINSGNRRTLANDDATAPFNGPTMRGTLMKAERRKCAERFCHAFDRRARKDRPLPALSLRPLHTKAVIPRECRSAGIWKEEHMYIHASDGEIGHIEDFLVEDNDWSIRYLVVDTRRTGGRATKCSFRLYSCERSIGPTSKCFFAPIVRRSRTARHTIRR